MRIIFLDVDGVLNNDKTEDKIFGWIGIDPIFVDKLKTLYDLSNEDEETRIVISSSWKRDEIKANREIEKYGYTKVSNTYSVLIERLTSAEMVVLGHTPENKNSSFYRGEEILQWIEDYNKDHEPISNYVILDDECFDFLQNEETKKRFIKTCKEIYKRYTTEWKYSRGIGLHDKHIEDAIKIWRGDYEIL